MSSLLSNTTRRRPTWMWAGAVVIALALAYTPPIRAAGHGFFDSLRLAKPKPVTTSLTAPPAVGTGRRIDDAVAPQSEPLEDMFVRIMGEDSGS